MAEQERPLAGRRALVTGASRGIGAAIARTLAAQGADLVLTARSEGPIRDLAAELTGTGVTAHAVPADMGDREALTALTDRTGELLGGLDILVNNAGVLPTAAAAEAVDWADWDATIGLNLSAPWFLACRARELMGDGGGVVVNNSSTAAYYPSKGLAAYNVSKSGLVMLTRVLALEWARAGIRVVGVAPGKIETELVQPILRYTERKSLALNPMRRIGRDHEVADLVAFLVSDRAGYLTGVTVPLDGGELLETGAASAH